MRRPLFVVCLCLVLIAVLRLFSGEAAARNGKNAEEANSDATLGLTEQEQVILTGRVYKKDSEKFYLNSILIQEQAAGRQQENPLPNNSLSENLICEWEMSESLRLGSFVTVQGSFYRFSQATNPGEFDSRAYYQMLHIGGKLTDIQMLETGEEYWAIKELLYGLRSYWQDRLYRIFPEKEAQIIGAMLLGNKEDLDAELKNLYKRNGIIHILSISGLHITIIGMGIYRLLRRIGMPVAAAAALGGGILVLYGVMTGMSISAYRAIGMYLIRMLAEVCGRTYDMLTALGVMAAIMTLQTPEYVQHSGFLLSFSSVLGIGVIYPALWEEGEDESGLRYRSRWNQAVFGALDGLIKGLKRSITAGLAITAATLPVQLWFYFEVPTYSLILNLLVLPFMGIVILFGLFAMLIPGLGILGSVDCLILTGFERLCQVFEGFPFHTWNPGRPKLWQIAVYYGLLLTVVWVKKAFPKKCGITGIGNGGRNRVFVIQWTILLMSVIILAVKPSQESTITFLDVGQGDCVCVQTSSGEVYLFDCGSSSRKNVGKYVLLPFLKYSGIREIDGIFVSHEDKDHVSGVEELFSLAEEEGIRINRLILPDTEENEHFEELLQIAGQTDWEGAEEELHGRKQTTEIGYIKAGDCWEDGGACFRCLHPPAGYEGESNASSECFYIELWNKKDKKNKLFLLLTGDVEKEGELMLIEELKHYQISEVTLLKVAHHGSRNATSEDFLQQINAAAAVISCGRGNRYGHPHSELLERLGRESYILQTPKEGAVIVTLKEGKAFAKGYLWR